MRMGGNGEGWGHLPLWQGQSCLHLEMGLSILFASSMLHTQSWWDLGVPAPAPKAGGALYIPLGTPGYQEHFWGSPQG